MKHIKVGQPMGRLGYAGLLLEASVLWFGCRSGGHTTQAGSPVATARDSVQGSAGDSPTASLATADASGPQAPEDVTFPPHWCKRAEPDPYEALSEVAFAYHEATINNCVTARLIGGLGDESLLAWDNYLIDYTHALAGCAVPPPSLGGKGFLPGGILQFGPGNLAAIGLAQPALGEDDVKLLIQEYLDAFAEPLQLSEVERAAVGAFLSNAAQQQIAAGTTGALSRCKQ